MAEQCVDQSVLAMTGTGMNDEPGRFVDDDEIVVFEENVERNRFRPGVDLFRRRFGDFDLITGSQKLPWPSSGAVEAVEADADLLLDSGAGMFRHCHCQKPIETDSCMLVWQNERRS